LRWVKDLDKLEMIHQAMIYEESSGIDLSGFFKSVENKIQTNEGKVIEDQLRTEYQNSKK